MSRTQWPHMRLACVRAERAEGGLKDRGKGNGLALTPLSGRFCCLSAWIPPHLTEAVLQLLHLLLHLLLLALQPLHQLQLLLAPVALAHLQLPRQLHDSAVGLSQEVLLLFPLPLQGSLPVRPRPLAGALPSLQLHLQEDASAEQWQGTTDPHPYQGGFGDSPC